LFRRANEHIAKELMNIDNIDDEKNGLLLFKPIESAFDHFDISFIYEPLKISSSPSFSIPSIKTSC
jgi:hypothetical protein